uniref:TTF-type domain-containing protein n=1 Tax=Cyprinus carpio TaxID=7962 RepID=A0A8C1QLR1_CYPCA
TGTSFPPYGDEEDLGEDEDVRDVVNEDTSRPDVPLKPVDHFTLSTDPELWGDLTELMIELAISKGSAAYHNRAAKYPASAQDTGMKKRFLTNDLLQCHLPNKQVVSRDWLIYSPSAGMVYCFACKLLSLQQNAFTSGYADWKHPERVSAHEKSASHRESMLAFLRRSRNVGTVDALLRQQRDDEAKYWREVLQRVVAVIKFLSVRGLAFRGEDELLGSLRNGNYLGLLELIAEFDPFLKEHLEKYGQKGRGTTSYLSSTVCDELICLMGEKVKRRIASELQHAKYFSIITDSTPNMSHTDQLTFIFRCVSDEGEVVERTHTGESLADCVVKMINDLELDLSNCRGQSYDNASNMSGKYNGLQAHLKKRIPLIHYVPCAAHSLNLVGVNSIEDSCPHARNFFDLLQSLYVFCAKSTHRWDKIFHNTDVIRALKPLSNTRWTCRADSTKALKENYKAIREALGRFSIDPEEKGDARREARSLCTQLDKLETAVMTNVWDSILTRFKATTETLQKHDITLDNAERLLESLHSYVASQRDQFEKYENEETKRVKKRKYFPDESGEMETYNVILDKLLSCLAKRIGAYTELNKLFIVLFNNDTDCDSVHKCAAALSSKYSDDLDKDFGEELIQFKTFVQEEKTRSPKIMLQLLHRHGLQTTFPSVFVALRIFLTLPVTNAEGERSFSRLKRVKNEFRTTMTQKRLTALSLLTIESDLVKEINFGEVVDTFASTKSRKKQFC